MRSQPSRTGQVAILTMTLLPLYFISYRLRTIHEWSPFSQNIQQVFDTAEFQTKWLQTDVLGPFNPSAIEAYCNTTTWHPNLIFNLPNANGGVGNVRAEHLDFLFYAIETGASIILPGMAVRREDELFDVWGAGHAGFGNMFDETWFREAMGKACSQMKIYDQPGEGEGWENIGRKVGEVYEPRVPKARRHSSREEWVEQTILWLRERDIFLGSEELSEQERPSIVGVERTMWETDTRSLPPLFRRNFGQVLRIRPDIRSYAALALSTLATPSFYSLAFPLLPLDPSSPIHLHAFYGAHLRTESDTITAGWQAPAEENGLSSLTELGLNFSAQTDNYISHALSQNLNLIYAASGNATEIARFKEKAAAAIHPNHPPLKVISKWDLLPIKQAEELRALHWDQQALVDLEILKRASAFGGMAKSSFAFTIAMARTEELELEGMVMDPWDFRWREAVLGKERENGGQGWPVAFDNGRDRIWGRNEACEGRVPRGAWP